MARGVGLIAEDDSDVFVAEILIRKIARKNFKTKQFVGRGCGKIVAKCRSWATALRQRGCSLLIVLHDLDQRQEPILRASLVDALNPCPIAHHVIVIPIRELEAWLLADHEAINRAMKLARPLNQIADPQGVPRPKERLRDLIYSRSDHTTTYVNTIHNTRIAEQLSVARIRARCTSFGPFEQFVSRHLR